MEESVVSWAWGVDLGKMESRIPGDAEAVVREG